MTTRPPPWAEEHDVELRRLAGRGYTLTRICIAMKRPVGFVRSRAKALHIQIRKPQRLPASERGLGTLQSHCRVSSDS
jgi:hypothetical protein